MSDSRILKKRRRIQRKIESLMNVLNCEDDKEVRNRAIDDLVSIDDKEIEELLVEPLIQALGDRDLHVREMAAWKLGRIGDERAVGPLIQTLSEEEPPINAIFALAEIEGERAIEPLLKALKHVGLTAKSCICEALGKIGGERAVFHLLRILEDRRLLEEEGLGIMILFKQEGLDKTIHTSADPSFHVLTEILLERPVIRSAASALGKIGDPIAVEPLIRRLYEERTILERAEKLGKMADCSELVEPLKQEIQDARKGAAQALGMIGDPRAVEPLIQTLKDEPGLRKEVVQALGMIGDPRAVEPLIQTLKDEPGLRKEVVQALGMIGDPRAVEPLIQTLKDENREVREAAAIALARIGDERAVEPLIQAQSHTLVAPQFLREAMRTFKKEKNLEAFKLLAKALGRKEPIAIGVAKQLRRKKESVGKVQCQVQIQELKRKNQEARREAVLALGERGDPEAVEQLIQALKDRDGVIRESAAQVLRRMESRKTVEPLIKALSDVGWSVRSEVAQILVEMGEPAVEPLIQALNSKGRMILGAVRVLGEMRDKRAVEPLIQLLKHEDQRVREEAAQALGKIGDSRAVGPLIQALKDKSQGVREIAARTLGKLGDAKAVGPLIKALRDRNWSVKFRAAFALGEIGDSRAVQPLKRALEDEENMVRRAAEWALERIERGMTKSRKGPVLDEK
ncbi:MAG: HEAT repeat domain-containing protein [Candidatus Freyarchaeota archaeon]|nr:HEAT repeat domain-containing protein [Candidatus Jordarchaeia archaeon]